MRGLQHGSPLKLQDAAGLVSLPLKDKGKFCEELGQ